MTRTRRAGARLGLAAGLLFCLAALAAAPSAAAIPTPALQVAPQRMVLPAVAAPDRYRIEIKPDADALTFKGRVEIELRVLQPTQTITLNAADLVISRAVLSPSLPSSSQNAQAPQIRMDAEAQTVAFTVPRALAIGRYTLVLDYSGRIYQQASGLFALDYVAGDVKRRALFTQFENSDARRFVPCWDEPGLKAVFDLTVLVPQAEMAVSNMPAASSVAAGPGLKRVAFAPTPKMSSYLLFFGLGDFERIHRLVDGVDVGVIFKKGDGPKGAYALDAAAQILPYYNAYFGTPFPLPKLDVIAGPGSSQFFGAMENWGAIFSFEGDLLIDPRISTQSDEQNVYIVTAHEMAHQWFGDLVTMAWWDDLWLNEGFASWMETKVTDHFHPEWSMRLQALQSKQAAMQVDARPGTHPIITPIYDVLQAAGAFDIITYQKGEAVLRMLEAYVGEDAWRAGVRRYMADHAYGNTVTDDFWTDMDQGSTRPIRDIAHDFTLRSGVPLIIEASSSCQRGADQLALSQQDFAIGRAPSPDAPTWRTPVVAESLGQAPAAAIVAGAAPSTLSTPGCGPAIVNAGQSGYFRTRYTAAGLSALTQAYPRLSPADQLGVFNDAASLSLAGEEPIDGFLDLTTQVAGPAADPVVILAAVERLRSLDHLYRGSPERGAFQAYARSVLAPAFERLGWTQRAGEAANVSTLRAVLITTLASMNDPAVLAEARRRFVAYRADPGATDAGTRRTVLRVVAATASPQDWDALHTLARQAKDELERRELYALLGAPEDPALAARALSLSLSPEVEATLSPDIIRTVSDRHPEQAFAFAKDHWDAVAARLEPGTRSSFMPGLIAGSSDPAMIQALDRFAADHIPANARQTLEKVEAGVRYDASLKRDRLPQVSRWIMGRRPDLTRTGR